MTLLVVAYPHLSSADYAWVQAIRQQRDPHYTLVEPHVTLVFPVPSVEQWVLVDHVHNQTRQIPAIPFVMRCATIVKDAFSPLTHLFLIPDEGNSRFVRLHDDLYTGVLRGARSFDVPYIPHMTIGADENAQVCKAWADAINREERSIPGTITTLSVIAHTKGSVHTVEQVPLQ